MLGSFPLGVLISPSFQYPSGHDLLPEGGPILLPWQQESPSKDCLEGGSPASTEKTVGQVCGWSRNSEIMQRLGAPGRSREFRGGQSRARPADPCGSSRAGWGQVRGRRGSGCEAVCAAAAEGCTVPTSRCPDLAARSVTEPWADPSLTSNSGHDDPRGRRSHRDMDPSSLGLTHLSLIKSRLQPSLRELTGTCPRPLGPVTHILSRGQNAGRYFITEIFS